MESTTMTEDNNSDDLKFVRDIAGPFIAVIAILICPLMMFYPAFIGLSGLWGFGFPTPSEWAVSLLVSAGGVMVTYIAFRLIIASDAELDHELDPMTQGYVDALDRGEIQGFMYVFNLVVSRETAMKVLKNRTPDNES